MTQETEKRLNRFDFLHSDDRHAFLKSVVLRRLHLPELEEDGLMNLVILSVKLQTLGISEQGLLSSVDKYDCHQTGLVAKKKALLLLGIERDLSVHLDDDSAVGAKTVKELCDLLLDACAKGEACAS